MTTRLHLPHPHIADHVAEVFEHAVLERLHHQPPTRAVPAADDWNDWHWYEGEK
jgi:hypothetical protein